MRSAALISLLLTSAVVLNSMNHSGSGSGGDSADRSVWTRADGNAVEVAGATDPDTAVTAAIARTGAAVSEQMRAPMCRRNLDGSAQTWPCVGDPVVPLQQCVDAGQQTVAPLWQRARTDAAAAWGDWQLITPATCAAASTVTPELVLAELRRMTLTPSPLVVQPDRGWVLVNKPTVAYADPAGQTLTTTILGTPVTITAAPERFTWDFADGVPLTTTSPGHPWPNADVTHTYRRTGTFRITVTTTWAATYTTADDPTAHDVPGTATTTSTSPSFTAKELRSHLVAETCITDPDAPGC